MPSISQTHNTSVKVPTTQELSEGSIAHQEFGRAAARKHTVFTNSKSNLSPSEKRIFRGIARNLSRQEPPTRELNDGDLRKRKERGSLGPKLTIIS
jgi:hypothetical protein